MARSRRPAGLADFNDPPLVEVALSIQFDGLSPIDFVELLGSLRGRLRRRYPSVEQHPPLPPAFEIFGVAPTPMLQIRLSTVPDTPRFWFGNELGTEILQVQTDRFVHNWRKVGGKDEYPRYERIRRTFFTEFSRLSRLAESRLGRTLNPNQCEVTYVNHIDPAHGFELLEAVRFPAEWPGGCQPEDLGIQIRLMLPGQDSHPIGRLIVQGGIAVTRGGSQVFQLMLTARGRPLSPDPAGARAFMDIGRVAIVNSFAALTSQRLQRIWGRRR